MTVTGPQPKSATRAAAPASRRWATTVRAYVALTKPRIIELLLVTTLPTMILAAQGWPPLGTAMATMLGGTMAAAGANTFNSYIDRDIDGIMVRTKHRPLVTGAVTPRAALIFGWLLSIGSVAFMAWATNPLAAALTALSIVFYVVIYTMLLKRRTAQNIVWGGAAGCMPVLIGWAAVTGGVDWPAWVLFAVIFLWTPPHYWPLSLRFSADYAAAEVPMLPVVAEQDRVARQIVGYSWAMVLASLALIPVAAMGPIYIGASVLLGVGFLWEAHALQRRIANGRDAAPMRLFHGSITYLSLLFLAVAIDPLIF